jgi:hypothetical protein
MRLGFKIWTVILEMAVALLSREGFKGDGSAWLLFSAAITSPKLDSRIVAPQKRVKSLAGDKI